MTTGTIIALTRRTFVCKVMSLLFNMLSRLVIAFLPRSKCLLISWLQLLFAVILEPKKIKSITVSTFPPSICFSGSSAVKESTCTVGDLLNVLRRSPGRGRGNPLQYSCLENPHGQRNLASYRPWGRKESDSTKWLYTAHSTFAMKRWGHMLNLSFLNVEF